MPADQRNPLRVYFEANTGRRIHKWRHYFEIYHRHLNRFRGQPITVIEIGVAYGGSLRMWRDYFGPEARIIGVDIDEACTRYAEEGIEIMIGDQADREFLRRIGEAAGTIDVLIEDGGHRMVQQIRTFEELYPRMASRGVFLVEDTHTSYIDQYGGGHLRTGTFMEYTKAMLDQLNAWESADETLVVDDVTRTTKSIHVYPQVVVFERGRMGRPRDGMTGHRDR